MSVRSNFENMLIDLQQDILRMGSLVEKSIYHAIQSLNKLDVALAAQVIEDDDRIDQLNRDIENQCIKIIATQQPMAKDLRIVITAIKIILSLERIADHSVDIARVTMCLAGQKLIKPLVVLNDMANKTQRMVTDGLDAYVNEDVEKAQKMCRSDDEIDDLYNEVFAELKEYMKKEPATIDQACYLLLVARLLERIGDHATNIGENVIYQITGKNIELN